jgi:carboxymethylenebutenolidase
MGWRAPRKVCAMAGSGFTGMISFKLGEDVRPGYLAIPEGSGPFPAVVVIHEVDGLIEQIKDVARRFAAAGYAALAVDLYAGRNRAACIIRLFRGMFLNSLDNGAIKELKAALSYLADRPEVDAGRIGAIGFCMGGSFAIAWGAADNRLQAVAPYYGMNPRPLDVVARSCPVVGSYAGKDVLASGGRKLEAALTRAGVPHDIKIYSEARHAFFNDQVKPYNPEAASDSWERVLAFFDRHVRQNSADPA